MAELMDRSEIIDKLMDLPTAHRLSAVLDRSDMRSMVNNISTRDLYLLVEEPFDASTESKIVWDYILTVNYRDPAMLDEDSGRMNRNVFVDRFQNVMDAVKMRAAEGKESISDKVIEYHGKYKGSPEKIGDKIKNTVAGWFGKKPKEPEMDEMSDPDMMSPESYGEETLDPNDIPVNVRYWERHEGEGDYDFDEYEKHWGEPDTGMVDGDDSRGSDDTNAGHDATERLINAARAYQELRTEAGSDVLEALAGRYDKDPEFEFYGSYGSPDDGARERFVEQQSVSDGKLPSGRLANQQAVRGYIGDKYVDQDSVKYGLNQRSVPANQDAVKGFLTKEPKADIDGIDKPEIAWMHFGGKNTTKKPRLPLPSMPGRRGRRRKYR